MVKLVRLRPLRENKLLTQEELAEKAGINRVSLAAIESGQSEPRPATIRRLAEALEVDPKELMRAEMDDVTKAVYWLVADLGMRSHQDGKREADLVDMLKREYKLPRTAIDEAFRLAAERDWLVKDRGVWRITAYGERTVYSTTGWEIASRLGR